MNKLYCTVFVIDIAPGTDDIEQIVDRVKNTIADHGGELKREDHWGKKRLAYEISKKQYGYYVELEYVADSKQNIPHILEDDFRLNDRILRYMTYLVDKNELKQREKINAPSEETEKK
ncbi:MAG: 30S ribosomal protein S6 [Calditrichia bacterium]